MKNVFSAPVLILFTLALTAIMQGQSISKKGNAAPTPSVSQKGDALTEEANRLIAELQSILPKLSVVDDNDKQLTKEDGQYKATDDLLKGTKARLQTEGNELEMEATRWDQKREQVIATGCSAVDTVVDRATAERCNPQADRLNAEHNQIMDRLETFKQKAADLAQARQNLSDAVIQWSQRKKANDATREELTRARNRIETRLRELQGEVDPCWKLLKRRGVTCEKIKHACGMVQFDGSPNLPPSSRDSSCDKK